MKAYIIVIRNIIYLILIVLLNRISLAQGSLKDYQRAEQFLPQNIKSQVFTDRVLPHWIEESSRFWYKNKIRSGKEFILIDPVNDRRTYPFNHEKLAQILTQVIGKTFTKHQLPFDSFKFINKNQSLQFEIDSLRYECDFPDYKLKRLTFKKDPDTISPDKKWVAFIRKHNLYLRSTLNSEEIQLTEDGEKYFDYAYSPNWYFLQNESKPEPEEEPQPSVIWSPDSKKLITFRLDRRNTQKLYLLKSDPENSYRAEVYSYERALPGDTLLSMLDSYIIFDIESRKPTRVDLDPFPSFLEWWPAQWSKDSKYLTFVQYHRNYRRADFLKIDAETGKTRILLSEESDTNVDMGLMDWKLIKDGTEIIWTSERDGWNHLYRINGKTGQLINQITSGEYVIRSIEYIDEDAHKIYFTASGKETGEDPYYRNLYSINFDGTGLVLLTPEDAEHDIHISPDGQFFVDNFSRVDLAPRSVLRLLSDGQIIRTLEEADIKNLVKMGWNPPLRYRVKARDNKTDIYGVIFYPGNFDASKKYPVVDATYTGPHTFRTPKSFYHGYRNQDQPIAELGMLVITVDGFGSAKRSKAFHNFSYQNLGDIAAEDHIRAIKQISKLHPYMDLDRIGIYGHSAGGYDAAHALLTHPEFYKVGIASAGNHDHRMAKIWWPEVWMGPLGEQYAEQSNLTLAKNLEGKLLLVHGDMDNNVNPASTLKLASELIRANKDFDLLILPNANHNLSSHRYFIRKRWDYFVKHLLYVEPPPEYEIKPFDTE